MEQFRVQPKACQEQVLPKVVTARVSNEADFTMGWKRFVGERGIAIGVDRYGASAPDKIISEQAGLTSAKVVEAAKSLLQA